MNSEKTTLEFNYNADGMRTQKVVTTTSDHVHSFQDTVHQPTCTKIGYTLHECICGYIYQDSPVPATGHSYTASVVADTCTANGYTLYSCTCGDSYQEGAKGHTFTTLVVEPSETVNGFTLHQCDCGYSYESDPVASLAGASNTVDVISNTKVYDYVYNGSTLTQLTITTTITGDGTTTEVLYFTYDGSSPMTVTYGDNIYYYVTNLQGDVIAILDETGAAVVTYSYDAWGNILSIGGSKAAALGLANPLTYRGYVYDAETSLYYLQSRYYNPEISRFINADGLVSTGQGLLGNNMFAYCNNNPVQYKDDSGESATIAGAILGGIFGAINGIMSGGSFTEVLACAASGAVTGAIAGFVADVSVASCGIGGAILASALAGGVCSAVNSCASQSILNDGKIDYRRVAYDTFVGAFVGGTCTAMSSLSSYLSLPFKEAIKHVNAVIATEEIMFTAEFYIGSNLAFDLGATAVTSFGGWLAGIVYDYYETK